VTTRARIIGTGRSLPARIVTNADLEKIVDTSDEWITTRTGIRQRHIAADGEKLSDFASVAARQALEMAGVPASSLDMILCATVTPDWHLPATACFIQRRIGAKCPAFDLQAGCSGFMYALDAGDAFIRSGKAKRVLVIGGELLSKYINWKDRATCVIFADGAGAVVLDAQDGESGVLATRLRADGDMAEYISVPGLGTESPASPETLEKGLHLIHMKGNETFRLAIRSLTEVCEEVLAEVGLTPKDVDLFVPHQANLRIIDSVGERLGLSREQTWINIDRVGNTSAGSIPIALDEAVRAGRLTEGDIALFAAFGAGLTWAGSVVRW
jgi:3-oxoacyl-[acyl-carrier-protein] synthase-3